MSKFIKQLEYTAVNESLKDARDFVLLNLTGVPAVKENQMRLALRKKQIRLHHVKNALAKRILGEKGITGLDDHLVGPTVLAWATSEAVAISTVSKEIESFRGKIKQIKPKVALAEGAIVPFEEALKLPTREEAIAQVMAAILGPARTLAAQIQGPGAKLASQVKQVADQQEAAAEAPAAAAE